MKTVEASQVQKVSGSGSIIMITDFVIVARKTLIFTCDYLDNKKKIINFWTVLSFYIMPSILSSDHNLRPNLNFLTVYHVIITS